jgi:hypothetical protein
MSASPVNNKRLPSFGRYRWWLVLLVAIAVLAFLRPNGMRERYKRIRLGMREAEVTEIMGRRPSLADNDFRRKKIIESDSRPLSEYRTVTSFGVWYDGSLELCVFYEHDRVRSKTLYLGYSVWEIKLRAWLRWLGF